MPGYTVLKNAQGHNVSLVEWQNHSRRRNSRHGVEAARKELVTSIANPRLYAASTGAPTFMARINRSNGAIVLEMTADAMQLGLLEPAITAALLLQCGRNID
ncbi:hypothetical protein NMY22_g6678 [Coprinellus aureogranulatus]|nr:hypothetical protein NMY22_g6678 [Coprinellus aureogranulatus]